jgi:hypothetical protein
MRGLCFLLGLLLAASASAQPLPAPLELWRAWVLHGQDYRACPFYSGTGAATEADFACTLSGPVQIDIKGDRAQVEHEVSAALDGFVLLVHADKLWPEALSVDGAAGAVLPGSAGPRVWLAAGRHRLRYALPLAPRPEALLVPEYLRLVELKVDGTARFPLLREGERLWLARAGSAEESESLELEVHRLWRDGIPQQLTTMVVLHVSGKAREIRFGPAWPEGYELVSLSGPLQASVEPGRIVRVQAVAGSHLLGISTRATAVGERLAFDVLPPPWPAQEIVSFAADHRLRVVDVGGASPVDAAQANVPADWRRHPAFALSGGEALTLVERSRGLGDERNRLSLSRQLWLDFDGGGWTVQDRLSGELRQGFRLDLGAPFELVAASEQGEALLVTAAAGGGRGIEVRRAELVVDATARAPASSALPAHGWSERMERVDVSLQLPPGWRLLHAGGVDRAGGAWLGRWDIYTVFIAAFTIVLGWRVGGPWLAAACAGLVILGAHEAEVPRYSLIALLILLLLWRGIGGGGRFARVVSAWVLVAALGFVWAALPFALTQARLALYPQLADGDESWASGLTENLVQAQFADEAMMQAAPAPPPPPAPPVSPAPMERVQSSVLPQDASKGAGARRKIERYAKDTVVQAGVGRPEWRWQSASLGIDGPVEGAQSLRLLLSPPWLTALWRIALLLALLVIVWRLVRSAWPRPVLAAGLAMALLLPGPAVAGDWPDQAWLDALRARLTEAPRCAPECARHAGAEISIDAEELRLALEVHAGAGVLVPVPVDERSLAELRLSVDGVPVASVGRPAQSAAVWVPVSRGVHRIELRALVRSPRIVLDFPLVPSRVALRAEGWSAGGLRDGRLATSRLELVREQTAEAGVAGTTPARVAVRPFVQVTRELSLDLDFTVQTRVVRVAPSDGGLSVRLPLLAGEQPADAGAEIVDGALLLDFPPGTRERMVSSRLPRESALVLAAGDLDERAETWRVIVGPSLSARFEGPPALAPSRLGAQGEWVHEYAPLPGESLQIAINRPEAVPGASIVADRVGIRSRLGVRSSEHTLTLALRATRGGSHLLKLPEGAELGAVSIDGNPLNLDARAGQLALPVRPGTQQVEIQWRAEGGVGLLARTPAPDLGLDAANVSIRLVVPERRWILALGGPPVGPAVLYWSALAVLLVLGWALARSRRALLPGYAWVLLALGFSTLSWPALVAVAVGFALLDWRGRQPPVHLRWSLYNLLQLALAGMALVSFAVLVSVIPIGLLGDPDMQISGGTGSYGELGWLADRATGALPQAFVLSLPMWVYKALMLAFALWLALSLVRWLKLAWVALTAGGGWKPAPGPKPAPLAEGS